MASGLNRGIEILALLLVVFMAGCSDSMSAEDYSHAFREAVNKYRAINKNPDDPAATPEGNGDGSVQARMQAAVYIGSQMRDIATSIKDLKPPERFKNLHDETYLFYRGQGDEYSGYAEALQTGNPDRIATAVDRLNSFAGEHEQIVSHIIDKLNQDPKMFKNSWNSVLKDLPKKN